jgi:hypothetical protein
MKQCLFLLFMLIAANALASTFKWTDAQGNVHYSDKPPPEGVQSKTLAPALGSGNEQLQDATAVPYLSERGRNTYKDFLLIGGPRAFAVCTDGTTVVTKGITDTNVRKAIQQQLDQLKNQGRDCKIYAINSSVVWGG